MPTYTVTACIANLSQPIKNEISAEITRIHEQVTGAPTFFVEVIFQHVEQSDFFIGGKPLRGDSVFVLGHIRDGRSAAQKDALIAQLVEGIIRVANLPRRSVWVYISELPPVQMAEFGHVLPAAGKEDEWLARLPDEDREFLVRVAGAND